MKNLKKQFEAFTLAEVLITLGIIGVVAAITIPTLIQNYKRQYTAVRVKKFYSMMSEAIKLSEIDNGPTEEWTKEEMAYNKDGVLQNAENAKLAHKYFNKYIKSYIKYLKVDENPKELQIDNKAASMIKIYLTDGSTFYFNNGQCAHFVFDINGDKGPNEGGKDNFNFLICSDDNYKQIFLWRNFTSNFVPYCGGANNCRTRTAAKAKCKADASTCTGLLVIDGWEFKSDYPYKL